MSVFLLILSHLAIFVAGLYAYRRYAAKLIAEAQEAKEWAQSELADFHVAASKDIAALRAKLPGGAR